MYVRALKEASRDTLTLCHLHVVCDISLTVAITHGYKPESA
jgi:hypothetical protein